MKKQVPERRSSAARSRVRGWLGKVGHVVGYLPGMLIALVRRPETKPAPTRQGSKPVANRSSSAKKRR